MPFLSHITSTFFVDLINRLGVRPPPPDGFDLINTVQPVSLVDSGIPLNAIVSTQTLDIPFTAGETVAPAGGVVLADTGALPAGTYVLTLMVGMSASANSALDFRIQRRDAANAANIWAQLGGQGTAAQISPNLYVFTFRVLLQANERVRILTINNVAAGEIVQANLWANLTL